MIGFKALIQVIHQSIHSAAQAVENEGIEHINKFFEKIPNSEYQDNDSYKRKISEAKVLLHKGNAAAAAKALEEAEKNLKKSSSVGPEGRETMRPIMVAMAFPSQTAKGIESVIVNVPLITLSPISSPRVKEVKFITDLEVTTDENNELFIAFPSIKNRGNRDDNTRSSTNTHIEITLIGGEAPDGLQKIIEGYEKALRAQIPG